MLSFWHLYPRLYQVLEFGDHRLDQRNQQWNVRWDQPTSSRVVEIRHPLRTTTLLSRAE